MPCAGACARSTLNVHASPAAPTLFCARWNEDLEGVLLAFRNERVLTQAATIHPYFPFVRLEVAAEVAVFRPRPGMRLGALGRPRAWQWAACLQCIYGCHFTGACRRCALEQREKP